MLDDSLPTLFFFQTTLRNFCLCSLPRVMGFLVRDSESHWGNTLDNISQQHNCDRTLRQAGISMLSSLPCRKPSKEDQKALKLNEAGFQ